MSRFEFALAGPEDDAELRARMAQVWMEGRVAVSFRREPSFFAGCQLQGTNVQVVKCTDSHQQRIVAIGSRATSTVHLNGLPTRLGYLADLRAVAEVRRGTLLARGYRFLHSLHRADRVPFYLSVIFDGNRDALQNLLGGRTGLPQYRPLGRILTPAILLDFARPEIKVDGVTFEAATDESMPEIVAFLAEQMPRKQYSPHLTAADFATGGRLQSLRAKDFFVARTNGGLVGCVAAWDQSSIRQAHIERYSAALALARPFVNLASTVSPIKPMPAAGERIAHLYLCFVAVLADNVQVFRGLLRYAYNALRSGPWHYAVPGLHEADALAPVLDEYRSIDAAGQLFLVHYDEEGDPRRTIDARTPYFELALA